MLVLDQKQLLSNNTSTYDKKKSQYNLLYSPPSLLEIRILEQPKEESIYLTFTDFTDSQEI